MKPFAIRGALQSGRGDRAPPRKPTSSLSPGLPRKAFLGGMVHPAEGRALHARKEGTGLTEACAR